MYLWLKDCCLWTSTSTRRGQGDTAQNYSIGSLIAHKCIHHTPDNLDMVTSKQHVRLRQKHNRKYMVNISALVNPKHILYCYKLFYQWSVVWTRRLIQTPFLLLNVFCLECESLFFLFFSSCSLRWAEQMSLNNSNNVERFNYITSVRIFLQCLCVHVQPPTSGVIGTDWINTESQSHIRLAFLMWTTTFNSGWARISRNYCNWLNNFWTLIPTTT